MNNGFFKIIENGKYKGKRLYFENLCDCSDILPIELYYLFQNSIKNNYDVLYIQCEPKHFIKIPNEDFLYIKDENCKEGNNAINYNFSENTLKIKEFQWRDLSILYGIAIKTNNVGSLFLYPELKNEYYYFNFFLIVKKNFDINILFKKKFDLINIISINTQHTFNFSIEFFKKIYNINDTIFKDNFVSFKDKVSVRNYNEYLTLEGQKLKILYKYQKNCDNEKLNKYCEIIKEDFWKTCGLMDDMKLWRKLYFKKLCYHFYVFDKIITSDSYFYTNFLELSGGCMINLKNNKIDVDFLYPYSLIDMFGSNNTELYSVFYYVWQWHKK